MTSAILATGVAYRYPEAAERALDGVDLDLRPGQAVLVTGPSGGGKSTLLRALCGLVPHLHGGRFAGRVVVDGLDTRTTAPAATCRRAAILLQQPEHHVLHGGVRRDVAFGLGPAGVPVHEHPLRVERALAAVGGRDLADRRTTELSGGELQRVALAGLLALEPAALLLDEPTAQLDDPGCALLADAIEALRAAGVAIVVAEHHPDRLPVAYDDRLHLTNGRVRPAPSPIDLPTWTPRPCGPVLLATDGLHAGRGAQPVIAVDVTLRRGEGVAIVGGNGAGKTTLLRALAGLDPVHAGALRLDGTDVTALPIERRYPDIAFVAQDAGRLPLTGRVRDELRDGLPASRAGAAERTADALGIGGLLDRNPRDLSVGERSRVALAAALAAGPRVLLLDEPTRGLDADRRRALALELRRFLDGGGAIAVATHDAAFAASVASRRIELDAQIEVRT